MQDHDIRLCFSLNERILQKVNSIFFSVEHSYVETLSKLPKYHLNDFEEHELFNKILSIRVDKTSSLEINQNIVHPYVKVHIVNLQNGTYL
jgi:hypothetical protein